VISKKEELVVVLDTDKYQDFYNKVNKVLKDVKFSLHSTKDVDEIRLALRTGEVVMGSISFASLELKPFRLVSYDLTSLSSKQKVKISKAIYGHSLKIKGKKYTYDGLKDQQGFELISSATMMVTEEKYPLFKHFLDENNVKYEEKLVWL
jgi:hypothetical protein